MSHDRPNKRRRLTPPRSNGAAFHTSQPADLLHRVAEWNLEQSYEQRAKKRKTKEPSRLPIKTADGGILAVPDPEQSQDESDSMLASGSEGEGEIDQAETPPTDDAEDRPSIPLQQRIVQVKEEIARLAGLLNEDPEEHAGAFKKLAQTAGPEAHPTIQKIALAAQAAVFKDVIPGYRIRAYKDEDLGSKVSKDIRRTRQYEQALITGYHTYIKSLASLSKSRGQDDGHSSLKTVALSCACNLLLSVPHFNFRTELLNILVHQLSARERTPDFLKAVSTLEQFFREDEDGAPSLEAVTVLSKMLKARDYHVREEVLNTFLHLRLLSELSVKASTTQIENVEDAPKLHGRKVKKEKREHRSKKERKVLRERKVVEKDMREANAAVDYEAREKMQSETLKVVFVIYFRILKARTPELMGAVLEGLAKYAHLINQDFFGDILEALKDIVNQAEAAAVAAEKETTDAETTSASDISALRNHTREALLSAQTAFTLLSHQETSKSASSLHLDLSFFTNHIYRSLYPLTLSADLEQGPQSLQLPDPHHKNNNNNDNNLKPKSQINVSTPIILLSRVLSSILLTNSNNNSSANSTVTATFLKRLLTSLLHTPEKSSRSLLTQILLPLVRRHGRRVEPLWYGGDDERRGDGVYRGDADGVDATRVWSVGSGVWEGELLRRHWCPDVRDRWAEVEREVALLAPTKSS